MMMNLFSIFDPSSSNNLSLNWVSMPLTLLVMPYQFWVIPSRYTMLWEKIFMFIFKEFKVLLKYSFSNIIIFVGLFMFILINNLMGMLPYVFTPSSHMSFCSSLSITLWLSFMIYGLYNHFNELMSHITPQGTPPILMPFMVMIESVSLLIRPLTLSIRLTANMVAGHLLLCLLGSTGSSLSALILLLMMMIQLLLMILETSVAVIQAYVFSVLTALYSSEI